MRTFLLSTILAVALGFAHPVLAQSIEDPCSKNHYILSEPCVPCPPDISVGAPMVLLAQGDKTLAAGRESRVVTRGPTRRWLDSLAVVRMDPSGDAFLGNPDPTWGDCGIARIPIWGADDEVRAIAQQPDGKIVVLGTALDPTEYLIRDYSLEPHSYLAVIRLNGDGTRDPTFATGGRLVFRVGQQQYNMEFDVNSWSSGLAVLADGRILVSLSYADSPYIIIPVALIRPDGTIETVYADAPYQQQVALELDAVIEFVNDGGEYFLTSDPDEAVMLDRGGTWYRSGRAFGTPKVLRVQ